MATLPTKAKLLDSANLDALGDMTIAATADKKEDKSKIDADQLIKKENALKGIKQLLSVSRKFSEYCDKQLNSSLHKTEEGRLKAMMDKNSNKTNSKEGLLSKLSLFKGKLHDYQVDGVLWLRTLFQHGVNGILADEMGLGKTIQVIALLCHLYENQIKGPFLIVVPLSTLPNWCAEFKKFAPLVPIIRYHGDRETRRQLMYEMVTLLNVKNQQRRPVVITTVRMISNELNVFQKIVWKYLIMDEAHSLKNHLSKMSTVMRTLKCLNKVLLTGTPLQNNLEELWSLLNFIMPDIFKHVDTFSSLLLLEDLEDNDKIVQEEISNNVISSIHKVLAPFMLRRLKSEVLFDMVPKKEVLVYCPMTKLQRTLYTYVIEKNLAGLQSGKSESEEIDWDQPRKRRKCAMDVSYKKWSMEDYNRAEEEAVAGPAPKSKPRRSSKPHFKNENTEQEFVVKLSSIYSPMVLFKKIVNHPYLVHIPVTPDLQDVVIDERIISESGKMIVLDAMLAKLKKKNHKVLIFSTLVMMLDLIEEYVVLREYTFCRLDGNKSLQDRQTTIEEFNNNPNIFLFLISTRAGGLGLNLTAADTVIMYDRDWNPQVDLQAQDRCHRIGQTKPVMVFSLVTRNTIDEKIVNRAYVKRRLEKVVIKNGGLKGAGKNNDLDLKELLNMLVNDATDAITANGKIYSDEELDKLLDRSELNKAMEALKKNKRNDNKENCSR